ncbi:MAG: DUF2071 domain-containing protein [Verrucomicrobiota bacterium]
MPDSDQPDTIAAATRALLAARERPGRWHVMHQRWEQLLFLHWRWDAAEIQRTLPAGLQVDTFDGSAWLAIVPFFMRGIRPRFLPPVPGISDFLEMNVRTYVRDERGRHGVWFYSLDCNQAFAVWTARTFFHLPYQHAGMTSSHRDAEGVHYTCQRRGAESCDTFRYRLGEVTGHAEPGTLEFFLLERYLLFAPSPRGLLCGQVHHTPYPMAEARVQSWEATPLVQAGFAHPQRPPDHILGSPGVDVHIYPLTA